MMSIGTDGQPARIAIRPAVVADAEAIVDLHFAAVHRTAAACYSTAILEGWSRRPDEARYQQMREVLAGDDELVLVAEESSGVVAFGTVVPRLRELRAVYVHPDAGRRGIGSRLLAALEQRALEQGISELQMDASVNAAVFYERAGYAVLERGVHRLGSGVEMACVRMVKTLVPPVTPHIE